MKQVELMERAADFVYTQKANIADMRDELTDIDRQKAELERRIITAEAAAFRLSGYREAMDAAKPEEPLCPNCWMERGQRSTMKPVASDDEHDQYRCCACGLV